MTSRRARVRGRLAPAVIAATWLATMSCGGPSAERSAAGADNEIARLQEATALLERRLQLATSGTFYLVLDPAVPDLALMLRGAELQRYPVLGLMVGQPRVAWVSRDTDRPWRGVVWAGGELDPARPVQRVVQEEPTAAQEGTEPEAPPVPPTAEERYPVPSRFHIRFADGLSVEIRPREADTVATGWARRRASWGARWHDVLAAMHVGQRDALRLRIVMNPKDAESLYRALPPDVRLLVLARGSS